MNFDNSCTLLRDDGSIRDKNTFTMNRCFDTNDYLSEYYNHHQVEDFGVNSSNDKGNNDGILKKSSVTSLLWVNVTTNSLLAVGSDDGSVRIWRDMGDFKAFEDNQNNENSYFPSLASSFHALPDVIQSKRGPGLIMCWQQSTGMLSVAGNSSSIRLWDINREQCVRVFHTGSSTCIGSLSCCADTKTSTSEPMMGPEYIDCQSWTRLLAVYIIYVFFFHVFLSSRL